jgi:hypothetical protein
MNKPAIVEVWDDLEKVNEYVKQGYKLAFVNERHQNRKLRTHYILQLVNMHL